MTTTAILVSCLIVLGGASGAQERERVPILGPCEGCEAVFEGMPPELSSRARIAPADEPGDALRIEGVVRDRSGRSMAGVIVYAYHTDAHGVYPPIPPANGAPTVRHGRLRGWAVTDEDGRYRFDTIRPAGYPGSDIPQHVHMHVIEPGCCTYPVADIMFDDDPRLTDTVRRQAPRHGGDGIVKPARDETGRWVVTRNIILGEDVPHYPRS